MLKISPPLKNKVIILGASRFQTKGIIEARSQGFYVIALDRNPESPGFDVADEGIVCDISDKHLVLEISKQKAIDGIVAINDTGVPVAAYVSTQMCLPGISEQVAEQASNKELMRNIWISKGIPCPKVFIASSSEEFETGFAYVGFPCILKPAHGLGGASRGVIVVRDYQEAKEAIEFAQSYYEDKATLIETFIDAEIEHSAEVIVYEGNAHVIAVSDKIKTPLPYRVDKNVLYPTVLEGSQLESLKDIICQSVLALEIFNGAAHVEVATTKDGFVLFELGARCGGGGTAEPIVHYSTGISLFVEILRIAVGSAPSQVVPTRNKGVNYHFLTPGPGVIDSVNEIENILELDGVLDADFFKVPGDELQLVKDGTQRSGFIITTGENQQEAYLKGMEAERLLSIKLVTPSN